MHRFANPARFLKIAKPATSWLFVIGLLLTAVGLVGGLGFLDQNFRQVRLGAGVQVYLRLLDVPVPSIYGPTADEPWGA